VIRVAIACETAGPQTSSEPGSGDVVTSLLDEGAPAEGDPVYIAGCMLYWGEGWKCRGSVQLSNSDPEVIRFFARFLRECFGVPDERMRIVCHLFADHVKRQCEIERFWLDVAGLPRSCLRKSMVNHYSRSSQRKRLNRLPNGTCKLIVNSTEILQTIYGSIQELGGFIRPEWLD
jgi:hypothetical protein